MVLLFTDTNELVEEQKTKDLFDLYDDQRDVIMLRSLALPL